MTAERSFAELKALIDQDSSRPFLVGRTVSCVVAVGFLHFLRITGNDVFDRAMEYDRGFLKLYQACRE